MASYNYNNNKINRNSLLSYQNDKPNDGFFSKILRRLTNLGVVYDDMVYRNTVGNNINQDPYMQRSNITREELIQQTYISKFASEKAIPYLDRQYVDKKRLLREYAIKDYLSQYLDIISDETIIFDNNNYFCKTKDLPIDYDENLKTKYREAFQKIYNKYGFANNTIKAWNMMRKFLVEGVIAIEIVWDDKKKNIIGFNELAPETIIPLYEENVGSIWVQYPEEPMLRRVFLDSQIIFISYASNTDMVRVSYLEGLISPYNKLKMLESTKIMFNIANATLHQKFTVPTSGSSKKSEQELAELVAQYGEEIEFDDVLGTVSINGYKNIPFNKQYWFTKPEGGESIDMEFVKPESHNLNEDDMLKWFRDILISASSVPKQRLEAEGGGVVITSDGDVARDEQKFANFKNRIRSLYKELIVKPLKLQILNDYPELIDDELFMGSVDIVFTDNETLIQWRVINNMEKKISAAQNMLSIIEPGTEDETFFDADFVMEYLQVLTEEDLNKNKAYKAAKKNQKSKAAAQMQNGGDDFSGGDSGGDIDTGSQSDIDTGSQSQGDLGDDIGGDYAGSDTESGDSQFEF